MEDQSDPNLPVPDDGDRDFHQPNDAVFDDVDGVLTASAYTKVETDERDVGVVTNADDDVNDQYVASDLFVMLVGDDEYENLPDV